MIRDITIGQYYPAQSPIHRLDPRVKIVCTLIFLVSLFVQNSVLGYALAFVFLACMIHISKVPAKFIGKGLKPIVILLLFTVAMNLFLTRGGAVLFIGESLRSQRQDFVLLCSWQFVLYCLLQDLL